VSGSSPCLRGATTRATTDASTEPSTAPRPKPTAPCSASPPRYGDQPTPPGPPGTLTELVARYLGHLEHTDRSRETIRRYHGLLPGWIEPALGTVAPTDVTHDDVDQLLVQMRATGQNDSSAHQARTLLRSAYRWSRATYSIRPNPARTKPD
jgi:hypothetical protein